MNILALAALDPAAAEQGIVWVVEWLELGIEAVGAMLVTAGVLVTVTKLLRQLAQHQPEEFTGIRLTFARYLALALEFQLAADILSTALAPSWPQIGKLAAIAVIRTGLNYFLFFEMQSESKTREAEKRVT